ncbi:hemolysin family protein [Falsarthrobacter nasiphocae]|uniref:CBS domain containing-hemolysin-like protein n=1 Tax=Falsarthrobacter nasiphocae TaxID=189863 RepID=A0AAE3YIE8_9MICC|nr:hemolysin family protein [Falsarthrobacter nasiphocae]MDR6892744.1 CBS domain containing-hemolysin-like protein [Falsarthrobacter nasiphocae]
MSDLVGILWLIVLLAGNAFFVASEFALMSARRSQIEPLAEQGNPRAKTTLWAMEHVSLMLACAQLGITVCSLLILLVAEPAIHHLFAVPLEFVGVPVGVADVVALVVAVGIVTLLHVIVGEMIPKNVAVSIADRAVLVLAPALVAVARAIKPVIAFLNWAANGILRMLGVEPKDEVASTFTKDELANIVEESRKGGLVEDDAGVISSALEFSKLRAADVMVPLSQMRTVEARCTPNEFEAAVRETGFSRFAVEEDGELTGYLHLKDVMGISELHSDRPISDNRVRTLANISADDEVEEALAQMQKTGAHMARVLTRSRETVGVLFLEDVIEELVGEIHDATQSGARRS